MWNSPFGLIEMWSAAGWLTVSVAVPSIPFADVAFTVALPSATPVTRPVALIVANSGWSIDHVYVLLTVLPFASFADADIWRVPPTVTDAGDGVRATDAGSPAGCGGVTMPPGPVPGVPKSPAPNAVVAFCHDAPFMIVLSEFTSINWRDRPVGGLLPLVAPVDGSRGAHATESTSVPSGILTVIQSVSALLSEKVLVYL